MSSSALKRRIPSAIFSDTYLQHYNTHTTDEYPWIDNNYNAHHHSMDSIDNGTTTVNNTQNNTILRRVINILCRPINELLFIVSWCIWLITWIPLAGGSTIVVAVTMLRITICISLYICVIAMQKLNSLVYELYWRLSCYRHRYNKSNIAWIRHNLLRATTYDEFKYLAGKMDRLECNESWKQQHESTLYDYNMLHLQLNQLQKSRNMNDIKQLMFTLSHIFHRQYCGIDNQQLYLHCHLGTKYLIEEFYAQVVEQLSYITQTEFNTTVTNKDKIKFLLRAQKSYGKTALCLSGGGSLAMYHAGVCRALLYANCLPDIINGTSGGAIIAGVMATRTDSELRAPTFLTPDIANRFGVHWLPSLPRQARHFIKHGVLMDWREFAHTARTYYWDLTFDEAYKRTRRHVSITVSYSTANTNQSGHAMVCNHVTTPHLLIWSAVTASCSLPGLMHAQTLFAKTFANEIVPFYPKGTEWVDGSLHADIPVQRLTELFNAQIFIVSQVNPHVRPFIRGQARIFGGYSDERVNSVIHTSSILSQCEHMLASDISYRLTRLAKMKIIPKIYGQDFRPVWNGQQRYTGDITIVPEITFKMQLKVISQPSNTDMIEFIHCGESATWPVISRVQNCMIIERTLDECIKVLARQLRHTSTRTASFNKLPVEPERGKLNKNIINNKQHTHTHNNTLAQPSKAARAHSEPSTVDIGVAQSIEPHDVSGPHQVDTQITQQQSINNTTNINNNHPTNTMIGIATMKPPPTYNDDTVLSLNTNSSSTSPTHRPSRPSNILINTLETLDPTIPCNTQPHVRTPSASGKFYMPYHSYHESDSENDDILLELEDGYSDSPNSMTRKMSSSSIMSPGNQYTSPQNQSQTNTNSVTSPVDLNKPPRPNIINTSVSKTLYK